MRKYIYNTLAVLMLTLCSVSIKAQELKASITWAESNNCKPVYANDIWHIVQGTQATITLETTVPDNTNEKRYEPGVIYKKGAKIVISNSDPKNSNTEDDFFDNIYSAHKIKRVEATRMINCNGEARGKIKELLISNF